MSDIAELERRLVIAWDAHGVNAATLSVDEGGTIAAPAREGDTDAELPPLAGERDHHAAFILGATIGAGGMGVVRAATQRALERQVAVKTLREDVHEHAAVDALLAEARATGALEHPNIVPVYALGRDDAGRPMMVMKRIGGRPWSAALKEHGTRIAGKALERHVSILAQVARAVHFAHERGVLHRDLKPDNVMLGEFGEIYVVDWGIAVALRPGAVVGMALACDVVHVAGTPEYMAPEMAVGAGEELGPASDVYLLGAILHELLTGAPPHRAATLRESLALAFASQPFAYPAATPGELADLCQRAMAAVPEGRPASAARFADALEAYREHASSKSVSAEAERRLERLRSALERGDAEAMQESFGECRFGFVQALRMWDGNVEARAGLTAALGLMIDHHLARGSATTAETLLDELESIDGAMTFERADAIRSAAQSERLRSKRLERLEREHDPAFGDRARGAGATVLGLVVLVLLLVLGYLDRHAIHVFDQIEIALAYFAAAAITSTVLHIWRRTLLATVAQRRMVFFGPIGFIANGTTFVVGKLAGLSVHQCFVMLCLVMIILWSVVALVVDRRGWYRLPWGVLTGVGMLWMPRYVFEVAGVGGCLSMLTIAFLWARAPQNRSERELDASAEPTDPTRP